MNEMMVYLIKYNLLDFFLSLLFTAFILLSKFWILSGCSIWKRFEVSFLFRLFHIVYYKNFMLFYNDLRLYYTIDFHRLQKYKSVKTFKICVCQGFQIKIIIISFKNTPFMFWNIHPKYFYKILWKSMWTHASFEQSFTRFFCASANILHLSLFEPLKLRTFVTVVKYHCVKNNNYNPRVWNWSKARKYIFIFYFDEVNFGKLCQFYSFSWNPHSIC